MKKNIAPAILLLIAFSVMLVHDVIPHRHHQENICFEHSACQSNHNQQNEPKEDSPSDQDACCILALQLILIPANHNEYGFLQNNLHPESSSWQNFVFFPGQIPSGILFLSALPFRQTPFRENKPDLFAAPIHGMRAPPVA